MFSIFKKTQYLIFLLTVSAVVLMLMFMVGQKLNKSSDDSAAIGGDFILTNHDGVKVGSDDLKGKYSVIFFGFANCPMICPTTLNSLSNVAHKISDKQRSKLNIVFITLDPLRDTVEELNSYMSDYDANIIALTGSEEEINAVAKDYKIFHEKHYMNDEEYMVNHSTIVYIFNKKGEYIEHFPYNLPEEEIYNILNNIL